MLHNKHRYNIAELYENTLYEVLLARNLVSLPLPTENCS